VAQAKPNRGLSQNISVAGSFFFGTFFFAEKKKVHSLPIIKQSTLIICTYKKASSLLEELSRSISVVGRKKATRPLAAMSETIILLKSNTP